MMGKPIPDYFISDYKSPIRRIDRFIITTMIITILLTIFHCSLPLNLDVLQPSCANNNITIYDFFKPIIPMNSITKDQWNYYKKINLKPISPYSMGRDNFTIWIDKQRSLSFEKMLMNIGDDDSNYNNGLLNGVIIASPSKDHPDYYYQWVRDGAITMNSVIENLFPKINDQNQLNLTLAGTVLKYINNSYNLQRIDNPSGQGINGDLNGLGEPKFEVNNEPFIGDWGRPQNDGPPLRLIAIFHFLKVLKQNNISLNQLIKSYETHYKHSLNLPFKNEQELFDEILYWDLKFVIKNWNQDSFDLWEEMYGKHFFTSIVQLSSLHLGLSFLPNSNDFKKELKDTFNQLYEYILFDSGYLNPNKNYIVETPNSLNLRSGLDIAVIIGSLLTHGEYRSDSTNILPFDVNDSGILNTLYSLFQSMSIIYPINHQRARLNTGVALGRYPEDVYNGYGSSEGNPWFLATSTASNLLYELIIKCYQDEKDLIIPLNKFNSEFWTIFFKGIPNDETNYQLVIPFGTPAFVQTMHSIFNFSESFLDKIREHVSDIGEMDEQFNKYTGFLQGAKDLTWSYGSFWTTSRAREKAIGFLN